jgi:hypothetical protein
VRGVGVDIDAALIERANAKLAQRALAAPAPAAGALAAAPNSVFLAGDVCDETVVARLLEEAKSGACVRRVRVGELTVAQAGAATSLWCFAGA